MSLINEALRKAQRDRTPERMPNSPSNAPASTASTGAGSKGMRMGLIIGLVVALAVLVGLVAGLSLLLLKGNGDAPATPQLASQSSDAITPAPATSAPATPAADPATPPPVEPITAVTQSAPAAERPIAREQSTAVVEELRRAREAAEAKAAAEAQAAKEAAARAAAKPSPEIIDWLSKSKMSGVKLSETGSKVILNGEPYEVGEYANFALGLKVMIIQEKRVLFIDKNGKKYLKKL